MSIQAIAWVLEHSDADGVDRLVLIALANHANSETGECHPGYRRIAHEAHCHTTTVQRAVDRLVALGEVTVVQRGQGRATTRYHLPWLSTGIVSARLSARTSSAVVRASEPVVRASEPVVRAPGARETRTVNRTARGAAREGGAGAKNPTRSAAEIIAELDHHAATAAHPERAEAHLDEARAQLGRARPKGKP